MSLTSGKSYAIASGINVKPLATLHSGKCKEFIKCEYMVVSAEYLFNELFTKCKSQQRIMYKPTSHTMGSYAYIDNFTLFMDTIYRMLVQFRQWYMLMNRRHRFTNMIVVDDFITYPAKDKVWFYPMKGYVNVEIIENHIIRVLKELSVCAKSAELDDYDHWEEILLQKYPERYNFRIHSPKEQILDRSRAWKLKCILNQYLSLTQLQLTRVEIMHVFTYVLATVNNWESVKVYTCSNNGFNYNILSKFMSQRTLMYTPMYVVGTNLFYYHKGINHYPAVKCPLKDLDDNKFKNTSLTQISKSRRRKIIDHFKMCENECNGVILDINSYMAEDIFRNLKASFITCKPDVVLADTFCEGEYNWCEIDTFEELVVDVNSRFSKEFKMRVV